jgi:DNA mismatch repair protein mutL
VSKLTITTRSENSPVGYKIGCYGGVVRKFEEVSRNVGTEMEVRDLFYNTPARRKFLRKMSTEYGKIRDIVLKEALSNSNVAFSLELDGKSTIKTSGKGIENAILELFGKSVLRNLKKFEYGYLGNVEILRSSKDFMFTFVNNRYVKSATIERAVIDGYYTKLMKGKYPFAIIFYNTDPKEIDVNVHPSKKIIKFSNDKIVYNEIKSAIDDFFYYNDRENWQPNIDLIKKNININENVALEKDDLFSDDILKGENQKVISLETFDGKSLENTKNLNEKDNFSADDFNKNDRNSEFSDNSENMSNDSFSNGKNFIKNKNNSSIDEIWHKMNKNSNKIVENNVENFEIEDKFQTKKREHNSNFENYKNTAEYRNFDTINENTENESHYKVGTFEKHIGKQFHYDILGQIFDTYILVRRDDELEIYDQHIIHERILYEELKDKFYNKKLESQHLLLPLKMEITGIEKNIIFENIEIFRDFGFDIDEFSEDEIVIRTVPAFDFRDSIENVFLQLLMDLKNEVEIKDLRENIIISMSCKGAVKAGQRLDMFEMQNMVRRIHEVGKYTCPHGRPIIVKLSRNDLDKMFGRRK